MKYRITSVYTKTGDDGTTGLAGGQRVEKDDPRIEAYGTVDELSSLMGWARQELQAEGPGGDAAFTRLDEVLAFVQNQLFNLGADLATRVADRHPQMKVIGEDDIRWLEMVCDVYGDLLPPLRDFILPGGSRTAAALHVCRTVARRAERSLMPLSRSEDIGPYVGKYLNRLSDAMFVLARWVNSRLEVPEVTWRKDAQPPELPPRARFFEDISGFPPPSTETEKS